MSITTFDSKLEKLRSLSTFEEEKDTVPLYEEEKNEKEISFSPTKMRKIIFPLDDSDSEDSLLDLVLDDEEVTYLNNLFLKPNPIKGLSIEVVEENSVSSRL